METSSGDGTLTGPEPPSQIPKFRFSLRELILIAALIALVLAALTPSFQRRRDLALVARVRADMRTLATGLESYFIDNMAYPACGIAEGPARVISRGGNYRTHTIPSGVVTANSSTPQGSGARRTITFRVPTGPLALAHTLTTPVAYLIAYPTDPFADSRGATFGYLRDYAGWILWSPGPDRDENAPDGPGDLGAVVEYTYNSTVAQPTPKLMHLSHDPTNGYQSDGDLFRVRQ
jgi:type IV pilus assembly protein PilA